MTLKGMETLKSDGDIIAWKNVNERVVYKIVNKKDIITLKGSSIILTLKASEGKIIKCYGTGVIQRELAGRLRKDSDNDDLFITSLGKKTAEVSRNTYYNFKIISKSKN